MRTTEKILSLAFVALLITGFSAPSFAQDEELTCEEARCLFQQMLEAECPCGEATNHGQHVSCVAHVTNELAKNNSIPKNCTGKLKRCAARSVCGKQERGFVTCSFVEYGTCLPGDTLTGPVCEHDGSTCATNTDCVVSSKCRIKSSGERCEASGGAVNEAPTCCSNCTQPPQ